MAKSPKRIFAEEFLRKNKGTDRGLALKLFNERPDLYKDSEQARGFVRYIHGKSGKHNRKMVSDKSLLKDYNTNYIEYLPEQYRDAQKKKFDKTKKRFIITWAQNNTPVHKDFLTNIEAYAKHIDASVHVILGRYKNPTSVFTDKDYECWDESILSYADANRHNLHKHLTIMSDVKIQPTATTPLSSMESISGLSSAIFGHPRVSFKTISALEGYEPKMLFTTGACTLKNYTDAKAGKKGEFHHTLGFVVIEIKDKEIFIPRQVTALSNGSFTDLWFNVKNGRVSKIDGIEAVVIGDKHIGDHCRVLDKQQQNLLNILKPKHTIIHDLFNGTSVNHHEEQDPIKQYILEQSGDNLIKKEIESMMTWLDSWKKYNLVVVASNHNDWLDRYIKKKDWKRDIKNAMEYMEFSKILLSDKAKKGIIAYLIEERFGKNIKTLGRNDSYRVHGFELSQHGDIGSNGSRGSVIQFKKLSTKMITADSHTPSREEGVLVVGTSTKLRVGYNIGASAWRNADAIIHKDGKAQHIIYMGKDKDFTTFKYV
mgnify:CR=1 FL=1